MWQFSVTFSATGSLCPFDPTYFLLSTWSPRIKKNVVWLG